MPQKKNPDAAELLRGKAPRVSSSLMSLLGTMHALPLAYSKDMQEDKEPLFDAIDTLEVCLEAAGVMLSGLSFDRERLKAASGDEFLAATDLADVLVAEGVPVPRRARRRRRAGEDRGRLGQEALRARRLRDGRRPRGARASASAQSLRDGGTLEAKVSAGGTSSARLAEQLEYARQSLADLRA